MPETTLDAAAQTELGKELTDRRDKFAEAYRASADLRARAETEPRVVLAERGLDALAPPGPDVRIVANTGDTIHFALPPDPNTEVADEALVNIAGGLCTGGAPAATPMTFGVNMWGGSSITTPSTYIAEGSTRGATSSGQ